MPDSLFIKICGITTAGDAGFAVSSGVSALGFIAYRKSPRYISPENVELILNKLEVPESFRKVVVSVNANKDELESYIDAGINTIQFHGGESAEFAEKFANVAEIWKVIRPRNENDILTAADFPADKFLLDPFDSKLYGGTGKTIDWGLAQFAVKTLNKPVILAGGLSPDNCIEAINAVEPFGIDVNSGVEISPGLKDHKKINELFRKIKEWQKDNDGT